MIFLHFPYIVLNYICLQEEIALFKCPAKFKAGTKNQINRYF
jgi:hypothetical protein